MTKKGRGRKKTVSRHIKHLELTTHPLPPMPKHISTKIKTEYKDIKKSEKYKTFGLSIISAGVIAFFSGLVMNYYGISRGSMYIAVVILWLVLTWVMYALFMKMR